MRANYSRGIFYREDLYLAVFGRRRRDVYRKRPTLSHLLVDSLIAWNNNNKLDWTILSKAVIRTDIEVVKHVWVVCGVCARVLRVCRCASIGLPHRMSYL